MAIDYLRQLESIDTSGYDAAIHYYSGLKKQFLSQLELSLETNLQESLEQQASRIINQITNNINNNTSADDGKTSIEILNDIFSAFANSSTITDLRKIGLERLKEEGKENTVNISKARHEFINYYQSDLRASGNFDQTIQSILVRVIEDQGYSSETLAGLVSRANQMFRIALSADIQGRDEYKLTGLPAITMQGYIREQLELNALKKIFSKSNMKVEHGGTKTVQGKETEFDIIMSFLDDMDGFDAQVQGTATLPLNTQDLIGTLLPQIQYYGEQVKSFNINTARVIKERMRGMRISENAGLQAQLQNDYVTMKQNLIFMAQARNILSSFGPGTVLFSSGAGRQWTADFIKDFRDKKYYLMMKYKSPGQVSSTVELNQPVLSIKNKVRKNKYYQSRWS